MVDAQVETQSGHLSDALMNAVLDHFASLDPPTLKAASSAPMEAPEDATQDPSSPVDDAPATPTTPEEES